MGGLPLPFGFSSSSFSIFLTAEVGGFANVTERLGDCAMTSDGVVGSFSVPELGIVGDVALEVDPEVDLWSLATNPASPRGGEVSLSRDEALICRPNEDLGGVTIGEPFGAPSASLGGFFWLRFGVRAGFLNSDFGVELVKFAGVGGLGFGVIETFGALFSLFWGGEGLMAESESSKALREETRRGF